MRTSRPSLILSVLLLSACGGGGGGGADLKPRPRPEPGVLVADLDLTPQPLGSDPGDGISFAGAFFFAAQRAETGRELFRTDGTAAATVLVKDILPGSLSSIPRGFRAAASRFYFVADAGAGEELWISDGTTAGTRAAGREPAGQPLGAIRILAVAGDTVFLSAVDAAVGQELFVCDGTTLRLLQDIDPGVSTSGFPRNSNPGTMFAFRGGFYFAAETEAEGRELWFTDGTPAGTHLFMDIVPGAGSSDPNHIVGFKRKLFFQARTPATGTEIWSSDGTPGGTALLVDFNPGPLGSLPQGFFPFDDVMLFNGRSDKGQELYKTDGTAAGTVLVKDIDPGDINRSGFPQVLTRFGSVVLFVGMTQETGQELWVTDGTEAGTALVKDLEPGRKSGVPFDMIEIGGQVMFTAETTALGKELWVTDGTASGTQPAFDIYPGRQENGDPNSANARILGRLGNELVLRADDGVAGAELWFATAIGVRRVNIEAEATAASRPVGLTRVGDRVLFGASGAGVGHELFATDGTAAGTALVRDLRPGRDSSGVFRLYPLGDKVLFRVSDPVVGSELFVSDGTASGTALLADINPGVRPSGGTPFSSSPSDFFRFGDQMLFSAHDEATGREPWITDGTPAGTRLLVDLDSGTTGSNARSSSPRSFVEFQGRVVFAAETKDVGRELFVTDGTARGTTLFLDFRAGAAGSEAQPLAAVGGRLVFSARNENGLTVLLATDGTAGSVERIDDDTNPVLVTPRVLGRLDDQLIVAGLKGLLRTDGTAAGTQLLAEVALGSRQHGAMVAAGFLWFAANDGASGLELWRTDGTPAGTAMVQDIYPGMPGSDPKAFYSPDGETGYFSARDVEHGQELWQVRADGSVAFVFDFRPGPADGVIGAEMLALGANLLLVADDGESGAELFRIPLRE